MGFRSAVDSIVRRLVRVKSLDISGMNHRKDSVPGKLSKCLSTLDLVSLGVGSCMGTGMYVVSGLVARQMAGPGVILSFMVAALASILSGVCYGEFGVRVPKTTGSAYMYSYVTVGEFSAFVIGWNLILEYLIGTAAGASALSSCLDSLFTNKISEFMMDHVGGFGIHTETYPDLVAMVIAIIMTLIVTAGVKKSVTFNNILNVVNLVVWVFMIAGGLFFLNGSNWSEDGFLPFGFSGVMTGAATCFYAFIGFDIIATTGEEAQNPTKSIPLAIMLSLVICLTGYVSVSFILTLAVPYYDIGKEAPLMDMFVQNHAEAGKYIVAIGSIAGLTVSLLGSLFPMPRIIYAMSTDGLLFRFLSRVNKITQTPAVATVIGGFLAAILALMVSLADLIEMMSIGTLLAYTLVSMCVLILRYQPHMDLEKGLGEGLPYDTFENEEDDDEVVTVTTGNKVEDPESKPTLEEAGPEQLLPKLPKLDPGSRNYGAVDSDPETDNFRNYNKWDFYLSRTREFIYNRYQQFRSLLRLPDKSALPTSATGSTVTVATLGLFFSLFIACAIIIFGRQFLSQWWLIIIFLVVLVGVLGCIWKIIQQPQNPDKLPFMAPCVPLLPFCAMFVNIFLMLKLSPLTWVRFVIWMAAGLIIYFGYGIWNSNIEARHHDVTRRNKSGKEAILMDAKGVEMPTEASMVPAHAKSVPKPAGDKEPIVDLESD
ncbi:probable cationic amino acid transporter [Asterias rubens]|uniref:probable cationic amino acid transporter n=1 Tax=Asterias rubens TaxID=7604 RepID=UPI0014554988|nr:probable cationic amino acid transporter [Asterias rubens]XP_033642072.1 probable cationic amino acid transporter [Asterias rubens]